MTPALLIVSPSWLLSDALGDMRFGLDGIMEVDTDRRYGGGSGGTCSEGVIVPSVSMFSLLGDVIETALGVVGRVGIGDLTLPFSRNAAEATSAARIEGERPNCCA